MNKEPIASELLKISDFYDERFKELGKDSDNIKSVGWGSVESQHLRFEVLFRGMNLKGKTILDLGCGLGDLVGFLDKKTNGDYHYIGVDISNSLIESARMKWAKHNKNCTEFIHGDIFTAKLNREIDISVESGALSLRIGDNENHAKAVISEMYKHSKESIACNFLSTYVDFQNPKNFHFSPEKMLTFAKSICSHVAIHHDYPLWEFTIQLNKAPRS